MNRLLINPVFHALCTGDKALSLGTENVKYFEEDVSPFIGLRQGYEKGFGELFSLLPAKRRILHATPEIIKTPPGWKLLAKVKGVQMLFSKLQMENKRSVQLVSLEKKHVKQMMELAALTKPGPFGLRTIAFGFYYGIFEGEQLVAMTGQRLHPTGYTEISAVCTHPDHLGKGYAAALVQHQVRLILQQGQIPFLHVRKDNDRAIGLYQRLGFTYSGDMNFYFMERRTRRQKN